jgi:predicted transcriptional regulator
MPTAVRLDQETERMLRELAAKRRESKSQLIRRAIRKLADAELHADEPATAHEALARLIGRVDSHGAQLSKRTGQRFTALLIDRQRARRSR